MKSWKKLASMAATWRGAGRLPSLWRHLPAGRVFRLAKCGKICHVPGVKFVASITAGLLLATAGLVPAFAVAPPGTDAPLEFRGVIATDGSVTVGLYDRTTGQSFWMPANGSSFKGVTVHAYDPKKEQLAVEYNGHSYVLTLASAVVLITPPEPEPPPADALAAEGTASDSAALGGGVVERRQSLRQVDVVTQAVQQRSAVNATAP